MQKKFFASPKFLKKVFRLKKKTNGSSGRNKNNRRLYRNLSIDHSFDNMSSGKETPTYKVGEYVKLTVRASDSADKLTAGEKLYDVIVYTGDIRYAGTDANVFITLYGSKGYSPKVPLKSSYIKDPFERGQVDKIQIQTKDVGVLYKIEVSHDNSGHFPGWFLNKIIIKADSKSSNKYDIAKFPCNDWIFKDGSHNNGLMKELELEGIPIVSIEAYPQNAIQHHTDKFKLLKNEKNTILRRGQTFKVKIVLAREYFGASDDFFFVLKTGDRPMEKDGTMVAVSEFTGKEFKKQKQMDKWGFHILRTDEQNVHAEIYIPSSALIGRFDVSVESDEGVVYEPEEKWCILFNPWCKDDEVYMDSEDDIKEYVLRQRGLIFRGTSKRPTALEWYYGQFEELSLDLALDLLEGVKSKKRDSARQVARLISTKGNSCDNKGILSGRWDGKYDEGKPPTSWSSTPDILQCYLAKYESVKYGQCWVFSAMLTTIFRALGIPCRPITNYSSAHDSDGNCSNDVYFDEDGEHLEKKSSDSVWNYHCWNDVWMARPDLPPGYGGWQAVDATPQERSMGLYQMGPCSLLAVKEGEIQHPFDTSFVFAEVNADTIYWQQNEDGKFDAVYRNRNKVGDRVLTKAVGDTNLNDITDEYKFLEGSVLERASVRNALLRSNNVAIKPARKEIEIDLTTKAENYYIGTDFQGSVNIKNTCGEDRAMTLVWSVIIMRYDGVQIKELKREKSRTVVIADKSSISNFNISANEINKYVSEETMIRVNATACVDETKQLVVSHHVIGVDKPDLLINIKETKVKVDVPFDCEVSFTNPLDNELTGCELKYDGSLIDDRFSEKLDNVPANKEFKKILRITPDGTTNENSGKEEKDTKKSLMISFFCQDLGGIQKTISIPIQQ